ncbi:type II toxin-antitoxin system ParD family antitoxin [Thalassomonas sp. RHCl1]|uniref:type II toxin-antitoxin system ParD family antitoxin n=1 Tax=Thalassomonas sp. RHCl1 TaxID=2995320 RepID=UPI00248AA670|nr:type II toxin-antitoxin system ParD family antitoxin [Thalassomonas sp. RHCl1]
MAHTTSINLGDHFTAFLSQLTENGRYGSASEAVRAALRLLEQEESKREALQNALTDGENSGESENSIADIMQATLAQCKAESNDR